MSAFRLVKHFPRANYKYWALGRDLEGYPSPCSYHVRTSNHDKFAPRHRLFDFLVQSEQRLSIFRFDCGFVVATPLPKYWWLHVKNEIAKIHSLYASQVERNEYSKRYPSPEDSISSEKLSIVSPLASQYWISAMTRVWGCFPERFSFLGTAANVNDYS